MKEDEKIDKRIILTWLMQFKCFVTYDELGRYIERISEGKYSLKDNINN